MMRTLILAQFLLAWSVASHGESLYRCTSEFGQTVPIRMIVLKPGAYCEGCDQPGATVPENQNDSAFFQEWNSPIEKLPGLKSKIKRRTFKFKNRTIFLDTRYATWTGESFAFQLICPNGSAQSSHGKCTADFLNPTPEKNRTLTTHVLDRRLENTSGRAELTIGNREHLGWIVRLFREEVPFSPGQTTSLSGSAELKFFREDPQFIFDMGVDEQLLLIEGFRTRLAALELKIRCAH